MLTIYRANPLTGEVRSMQIPMDQHQFYDAMKRWRSGVLIQDAFPLLSADEREFVMTGLLPGEWEDALDGGMNS